MVQTGVYVVPSYGDVLKLLGRRPHILLKVRIKLYTPNNIEKVVVVIFVSFFKPNLF